MTDANLKLVKKSGRRVSRTDVHLYQSALPNRTWDGLERIADENNLPINVLLKMLADFGIKAVDHQTSGGTIIFRHPDYPDREIIIML